MDAWRHHQRQLQQQKAPSPMYRTGVSEVNMMPCGEGSYNNARLNALNSGERTNPLLISEQCCTEIHPPPPLKRQDNVQSQLTPPGHLSERINMLPCVPQLEQQFFSGYDPSCVQVCRRTVSSEYVINYKDGSALKAGFSYHEPSCKCQECITRLFSLHPEFENKRLSSISKPAYLDGKKVYAERPVFPNPAGNTDEQYLPVPSKPTDINNEGCITMQTGVSKPSVYSDPERVARWSGVPNPTDINNEGCVTMQSGVFKPSVYSDLERVARWSGVPKQTDINNEGCVTMQTGVSKPSVYSDPERVARWSGVPKPTDINNEGCVTMQTGVSKPSVCSDPEQIAIWSGISKPPNINNEGCVTMQTGDSKPCVASDPGRGALWPGDAKPTITGFQPNVSELPGTTKRNDLVSVIRRWTPPFAESNRLVSKQSSASIATDLSNKERPIAQSRMPQPEDLSNESCHVIPSKVYIPSDHIDREVFEEQSKALKRSNRESLIVEHTEKDSNVDQQIYDLQTELAVKKIAYHISQSHELLSNRIVTNAKKDKGEKLFKCQKCSMRFRSKAWLNRHTFTHTGPLQCRICDDLFFSHLALKKHMAVHRKKGKIIAQSSISESKDLSNQSCLVIPSNISVSNDHIDREPPKASKTSNIECPIVQHTEKGSNVDQQIYEPQTELVVKEEAYHISQNQELPSNRTVTNAKRDKGEKRFKCAKCSMRFRSIAWLKRHSFTHTGPLQCRICDDLFFSKRALTMHMAVHRKKRKIIAQSRVSELKDLRNQSCLVIPSNISVSSDHIDREQPKASKTSNIECPIVQHTEKGSNVDQQIYEPQTELVVKEEAYHISQNQELPSNRTVTNAKRDKGEKRFKCAKCSMRFRSIAWLKRHSFTHTGPLLCRICDDLFFSKRALTMHMAVHRKKRKIIAQSRVSELKDLSNQSCLVIPSNISVSSDHIDREQPKASKTSNIECHIVQHTEKGSNVDQQIYEPQTELVVKEGAYHISQSQELPSNQTVTNAKKDKGEKRFKCAKCSMRFRSIAWLKRHSFTHTGPVPCRICDDLFFSHLALKKHMAVHRKKRKIIPQLSISESKDLRNQSCLAIPSNISVSSDHIDREQPKASKTLNRECPIVQHTEKGCNVNQQIYEPQTELVVKEEAYHISQNQELPSNQTVTNAKKDKGENQFKCAKCNMSFRSKAWLEKHSFIPTGPLQCKICDEPFFSNLALKKHMAVHHKKEKPTAQSSISESKDLSNQSCLAIPSNISIPSDHIDREQPKASKTSNIECLTVEHSEKGSNVDQQIYEPQTELVVNEKPYHRTRNHELFSNQTVTNAKKDKGEKLFKCQKCSMRFRSKAWLNRHTYTHTGPLQCRICDDLFFSNLALKKHMAVHRKKRKIIAQSRISESKDLSNQSCLAIPSNISVSSDHIDREQPKASKTSNIECHIVQHTEKGSNVDQQIYEPQTELVVKEGAYHISQSQELPSNRTVTNGEKRFKCAKCSMSFGSKTWVKRHSITHNGPSLKCKICGKFFLSSRSLQMHTISHGKKGKRTFKCEQCAEVFFSPYAAYKHKLSHKEDTFQCNVCNEQFGTHSEYLAHVNVHRTPTKSAQSPEQRESADITCDLCSKVFRSRGYLRQHKLRHKAKRFECEVCKKLFKSKFEMTRHLRVHTTDTIHCQECDVSCSSKWEYSEHLKTHPEKRRLKCVLCKAFFLTKHALASHLMQHKEPQHEEPKLFKCSQCNKQYTTKRLLDLHFQSHSEIKYYKCKECNKKFKSQRNLYMHEDVHVEVKTFHCSICRKGFSTTSGLEGHMKAHRKKYFNCTECDATFERSEELKEHALTHPKDRSSTCMVCDQLFRATELFRCNLISSEEEAPFECLLCEACFNNNIANAEDRPSAV